MTEGETDSCSVCEWAERDTETHLYVCKGGALWLLAYHRHSQLPNEDFHSIRAQILTRITRIILVLSKSALSILDARFSRVSSSTLVVIFLCCESEQGGLCWMWSRQEWAEEPETLPAYKCKQLHITLLNLCIRFWNLQTTIYICIITIAVG